MGEGREGDWECSGCKNRNYAFRTFCNRCKQPRLLVDAKTPADSKWLPRIGDWICTSCTNNNYASRGKCKKCGQPKEVAAMPAIAMSGASLPTYSHYFAKALGGLEPKMNLGFIGNVAPQQSSPLSSNWAVGGADKFGFHPAPLWPLGGIHGSAVSYANPTNQLLSAPKGWQNGDWMCTCGFHNYSSRQQCKKCSALPPGAHGTKRLASEEFINDWDNKRLNVGLTDGQHQTYTGLEQVVDTSGGSATGLYASYQSLSSSVSPNLQVLMQFPQHPTTLAILGKGAKQWRDGDWMCTNCSNHNYASRAQCNRCKTQRDASEQPVDAI